MTAVTTIKDKSKNDRLNMEIDLQVYLSSCVQLYSLAETPQLPPPLAFGLIYEGAIGQPSWTTSLVKHSTVVWEPLD